MTTINTLCKNPDCRFDLSQFTATVDIDKEYYLLHCHVCGEIVHDFRKEFAGPDIFYDADSDLFLKWIDAAPAGGQKDWEEPIPAGNLSIRVHAQLFNCRTLFYEPVLAFAKPDPAGFIDNKLVDHQFFASPENCRRYGIEIHSAKMQPNSNYVEVRFGLRGSSSDLFTVLPAVLTKPVPNRDINLTNSSLLKAWPDFKRSVPEDNTDKTIKPWREYFVYFHTWDKAVQVEAVRVVGENPGEEKTFSAHPTHTGIRGQLDFPPEYIEIAARSTKPGSQNKLHKAAFQVNLRNLDMTGGGEPLRLSVDFGTSNTCFCYSGEDPQTGQQTDAQPLQINDHTLTLIEGTANLDVNLPWLPVLKQQVLLPSELMFFEEPKEAVKHIRSLRPVIDYTIPILGWRKEDESYISTGFKWQTSTEPDIIAGYYQDLQKMYLGLALRLALAELAANQLESLYIHACAIDLFITYPLSMSESERTGLIASYDAVRSQISSHTGITVNAIRLIDESFAAEQGTGIRGAITAHKLYIDVGGGTTDVSVVEELGETQKRAIHLVDSVRYAGNDFLMVLANDDGNNGAALPGGAASLSLQKRRPGKLSTKSLIELQRRIRSEKEGLLTDLGTFGGNQSVQEIAIEALDRFINGLIEYTARLVAWKTIQLTADLGEEAQNELLQIFLVGNGWRFLLFSPRKSRSQKALDEETFIRRDFEDRLNPRLDEYVADGIIRLKPRISTEHPTDPKMVVARGALDAPASSGVAPNREPPTILGSDIRIVQDNKEVIFEWHHPVPIDLDEFKTVKNITMKPSTKFEKNQVPDYRNGDRLTTLDEIDIKKHLCDEDNKRITHSAFRHYLERWHKRNLHPVKEWI